MATIIVTNTVVVARFADALFDLKIGSTTMAAVNTMIANSGLDATLNEIYANSFGGTATSSVAATMVANLGITEAAVGADAVTLAEAYVTGELNSVAMDARGAKVAEILNAFSNLDSDATFGTVATAFNADIDVAVTYSQNNTSDVESDSVANQGTTFTLTAGVDTFTGNGAIDTFNASQTTLTALDTLDGGGAEDTLNIVATAAVDTTAVGGLQVSNIETVSVRSAGDAEVDTSGWTGVTALTSTIVDGIATFTGAATTDITLSGVTGAANVSGGLTQTVSAAGIVTSDGAAGDVTLTSTGAGVTVGATTDSAAAITATAAGNVVIDSGTDVTATTSAGTMDIGGTTVNTGTITATHTAQAANDVNIDGGTDVTVTTTGSTVGGDTVIGATTAASGAVSVTQNISSDGAAVTGGAVTATGGTSITIAANATNTADADADAGALTVGTLAAIGDDNTTAVSIAQTLTNSTFTTTGSDATNESTVVTFSAMTSDQTLIINGLTFTASKNLTAAEVAEAFSSLTAADTQASGGPTANGIYTGAFNTAVWTTGTATSNVVTFTAQDDDEADITFGGTAAAPTQVKTAGVAAVVDVTSTNTTVAGAATVTEGGTASITTITLDSYGASSDIVGADALATLNLSNSAAALTVDAAVTTLALNLDGVTGNVDLDDSGDANNDSIATLNITTSGSASTIATFEADAVTTLNVTAGADLDISGTPLAAVTTVTTTGAGDVDLGDISATATSVDASGSTGDVTVTLAGNLSTFTGGTGADDLTLDTTAVSKAVDLGAGDDTLTLATGTTAGTITSTIEAGTGTDTLVMAAADAVTESADGDFLGVVTGFENLTITGATTAQTVNAANLGLSYVTVAGVTDVDGADDILTINDMASGGTVVVTATIGDAGAVDNDAVVVGVTDAATGTADSLNIMAQATTIGTVTAANVESIVITADNNNGDSNDAIAMTLAATSATSLTVTGADDLTLTNAGNTALTSIDASAMTGALSVTDAGSTLAITGGAGNDTLVAVGSGDTLVGGAGNDTLTGANLTTLTGGAGNDTFVVNIPTNVNSYSTITDISSGDIVQLTATESFVSASISLADTAVFQDYANAAVNQLATDDEDAAWFQYSGNTYIVINDDQADAVDADFESGADAIIKITGTVDLSTASYNQTDGTLEIA